MWSIESLYAIILILRMFYLLLSKWYTNDFYLPSLCFYFKKFHVFMYGQQHWVAVYGVRGWSCDVVGVVVVGVNDLAELDNREVVKYN